MFRHIISGLLVWAFLLSQISGPEVYADPKSLNEVSTLAAPSVFRSSHPDEHSEEFNHALISKKEFLSIAFDLYASLLVGRERMPAADIVREIMRYADVSPSFAEELARFDVANIRMDPKAGVLYIPYGGSMEARVYSASGFPSGMPVADGETLLERGSGSLYAVDVVTVPPEHKNPGARVESLDTIWRDSMARLASEKTFRLYRRFSHKERERLNEEQVYREIFDSRMFPKIRKVRAADRQNKKTSVITIGITGSAASGKTTIAATVQKELSEEFSNVRIIYFDDWLLQASDREIDPVTKKTTEDVLKKFEAGLFNSSMKAFIRGQDLLKPVYGQTAKGTLKLTLDDKGAPVILFGPRRKIYIVESQKGPVLSVRDEAGKVIEEAAAVEQFGITLGVEKGAKIGEIILRMIDTFMRIGPLEENGGRSVRIMDDKGNPAKDMIDPDSGELIAETAVTITNGGYIGKDGKLNGKPWKIKERIPHEEGIFIIEGILSLYDDPDVPQEKRLPSLYTTSLFIDANFEIRLERGFARERSRAETRNGRPMPLEDALKYVNLFMQRKEKLEDPFIYAARDRAEFVGTTESRAESIFSLYRKGQLLEDKFAPVVMMMGLDPQQLYEELDRIEEDYVLNELRRSSSGGELQYERKIESTSYDVFFLKNGMVVKAPKTDRALPDIGFLALVGGDFVVPTSFVNFAKLNIKIDGKIIPRVLIQNRITSFGEVLAQADTAEAAGYVDLWFGLQENLWKLGIVDKAPGFGRYGSMMTNLGKPSALLFSVDGIGNKEDDFKAANLWNISDSIRPDIKAYFVKKSGEFIKFTRQGSFGCAESWKVLPRLYDPALSSLQIDYISSIMMERKTVHLWRLFKRIKLPENASPEIVWTRLWLDTIARHTWSASGAINAFYKELLKDPLRIKGAKPHELRDYIFSISPPLSRQDKAQINKFLTYLCRIPLKMIEVGAAKNDTKSTLRIKPQVYDRMAPKDRRDLMKVLAAANPEKLKKIIDSSAGRIRVSYDETMPDEGRTVYIRLRDRIEVDGMSLGLLRIKGARPVVEKDKRSVKDYKGWGSVRRVMESYSSGAILVRPGHPGPLGSLLYPEALTEYELMERFHGSKCGADLPIGVGRYRDLRYKNGPVGYVICGMEFDDHRLGFLQFGRNGVEPGRIALVNIPAGLATDISPGLPSIYEKIGLSLRYFHDQGYSHRWPHIGNIGLRTDDDLAWRIILRDLNDAQDISTNSLAERAADRFLDVSRVLYDALKIREYEDVVDDTREWGTVNFPGLAESFLKGYFRELDPDGSEFRAILISMGNGFVERLDAMVGDRSDLNYEELSENSHHFGSIIAALRKVEEENSRQTAKAVSDLKDPRNAWPAWGDTGAENRCLVFVSGGDCAGLNPFIGYLSSELAAQGIAVAGVNKGLEGLIKSDFSRNIVPVGREMSARMPYWSSVDFGSTRKSLEDGSDEAKQAIANIAATARTIVVIGGNDHLNEAAKLAELLKPYGITVIAIPKTIDNDTMNTTALGVLSSVAIAREEVYRAAAVPGSNRCVIVEGMGRNMGSLALQAANRYPDNFKELSPHLQRKIEYSRPTIMTLIPEHIVSIEGIRKQALARMRRYGGVTVVAAEGFKLSKDDPDYDRLIKDNPVLAAAIKNIREDAHHNLIIPQGIAAEFIAAILKELHPEIEVLGFTPRGTVPTEGERNFARGLAKKAAEAVKERSTGQGVACSDLYQDPDRGVIKLVPVGTIAGKTPEGKSLVKRLDQIITESDQIKAGAILRDDQPLEEFGAVAMPAMPRQKSLVAVAGAVLAVAKSAWAHSRPSILHIDGPDADKVVAGIRDTIESVGIRNEGIAHDIDLVKKSFILFHGGTRTTLSDIIRQVYNINSKNKYVNIILSGNFRISKTDSLLPSLVEKSEELAARLKASEKRSKNSTDYVFNGKTKDLGQVLKLILLNAEQPSADMKKMTDVRLTSLGSSLNALPGEEHVSAAELSMQAIHEAHRILAPAAIDKSRMVFHVIDPMLIPEEQAGLATLINKLTRGDDFKEKVVIGKGWEPLEDTIAGILKKYPDAIIDVATRDPAKQAQLEKANILSLVFKPELGECNFRQLEGIIAALRAVQRNDREALLKIYAILTGIKITESMPEDIRDLIKRLIFTLPAVEIKDSSELRRLNDNLLEFIRSA
ncbi:MAG: 6-phosphofructokinase [Candidatus Omnitrophica bacterium]|nr:6-phosphofructokinase [Candidatus Omnitrophota bacterium]